MMKSSEISDSLSGEGAGVQAMVIRYTEAFIYSEELTCLRDCV